MDSRLTLRGTAAAVLAVLWIFGAWLAGGLLGYPSESLGWLWAGLVYAAGLIACAVIAEPASMRVWAGAAAAAALVLGFLDWQGSPPTHERLRHVADDVPVPATWELRHDLQLGNTWCFKGCPTVERSYAVPGSAGEGMATVVTTLEHQGWDSADAYGDGVRLEDGRWAVAVRKGWSADADGDGSPDDGAVVDLVFSG